MSKKYFVGAKFGKLTITERLPKVSTNTSVLCKCDCGNPEQIKVFIGNLGRGHTTSCGCAFEEAITKHGLYGTPAYSVRAYMIQRCCNPNHDSYADYGGRGIKVCDRWLESVENFVEDMGQPPEGLTLERVDVNGDYCPENCKWETATNQMYNQRIRDNNTSGRTGVYWSNRDNLWKAQIGHKGEVIPLGHSKSFDVAVKLREEAELKYYGWIKQ